MAVNFKKMFIGPLTTTATVIYQATSDTTTTTTGRVQDANVVNVSASDVTLTVWAPQSGGDAGNQNVILQTWTVPAATNANGGRVDVPALRGRVIPSGGTIVAKASADGALTLSLDGMEQTVAA